MKAVTWIKHGKIGNTLAQWDLTITFEDISLRVCTIIQFKKGEYVLPTNLFPRNYNFQAQKTKSLPAAKKKCEAYLKRTAAALNEYFKTKKHQL